MNKYDRKYLETLNDAEKRINDIYSRIAKDLATSLGLVDASEEFTFKGHRALSAKADRLIGEARVQINIIIRDTTAAVWAISNAKADDLVATKFTNVEPPKSYTLRNEQALEAFQNRTVSGMKVSDRVWRNTDTLKQELQTSIDAALGKGQSAASLSRDIKKNLLNPDAKFRRIRDKWGALKPSTVAAEFHPGRGVYRSSYKNALRLAGNEINKAYRRADWLKWQQLDFVIGYEIITSPRSATVCPMCEELEGRYPKWFVFSGWHIQCRCTAVPVMCTDEQFDQLQESIRNGTERPKFKQPPLPGKFTSYYKTKVDKVSLLDVDKRPDWFSENIKMLQYV